MKSGRNTDRMKFDVIVIGAGMAGSGAAAWLAADGHVALIETEEVAGFFWCVGQGGYGIQTSPAAGRLVADLVAGRDPGEAAAIVPMVDPARYRGAAR